MIDNYTKEKLSHYLGDYLENTHHRAKQHGKYSCFCGSSDALHFYKQTDSWKCFSCGEAGDIFALYAKDNDLNLTRDFVEISKELGTMFGVEIQENRLDRNEMQALPPRQTTAKTEPKQDYSSATSNATERLQTAEDGEPARVYLLNRAISRATAERFGLGSASIKGKEAVIIPTADRKSYNARFIDPGSGNKYYRPAGSNIQPFECIQDVLNGPCWLVEGEFNALSIWQAGGSAVAIGGASNAAKAIEYAKTHHNLAPFVLGFDPDPAGETCSVKVRQALKQAGIDCYSYPRAAGDARDINDILQADEYYNTSELSEMVSNACRWKGLSAETIAKLQTVDGLTSWDRAFSEITSGKYSRVYGTPWPSLNEKLGGGLHSGLAVLGAGTGAGKTTLILQLVSHLVETGERVLYISLEMAAVELYTRLISRLVAERGQGRFSSLSLRQKVELYENQDVANARNYIRDRIAPRLNIVEGIGDFSAGEVAELTRYYTTQDGKPPVVVVDYLQLLAPSDPRLSDKQATDNNVKTIKRTARDYNALVVCISSFNRESYDTQTATLKAFKESGAIEYTADLVLSLEATDPLQGIDNVPVVLNCLKNRDGRRNWKQGFSYYPKVNRFLEAELQDEDVPEPAPATRRRSRKTREV